MDPEPDDIQRLGIFDSSAEQQLRLIRTIVAMANTRGGTIEIGRVDGDRAPLEAQQITEAVNRYLAPRLKGIECARRVDGSLAIHVPESDTKPHVFTARGGPEEAVVFHAGQIWVRDGTADRPAGGDDLVRFVREAASQFLERLSIGIRDPSFSLRLTEAGGIPVHLAEDEESVPVSPNLARLYPYTTKTLAQELGKPTNWVATAAKVLKLKESRENAYGVPAPSGGRVIQWRYSMHALREIEHMLEQDPEWNPYHG